MNGHARRSTQAIVAHGPQDGKPTFKLESVTLRDLQPDELLVKIVATGICHTDIFFASVPPEFAGPYPKILGHEGSGYVQQVGSEVKDFKEGDAVLLSYAACSSCHHCAETHPAFCDKFELLNYAGEPSVFDLDTGKSSSAKFFGQSSFSNLTVVKQFSAVNVNGIVKNEEELRLFAPLGCGIQTGAGTVDNLAEAGPGDAVVVMGLGGVGLAAILAAKLRNCKTIIGVDRFDARLELAKQFGATHVINTSKSDKELPEEVRHATNGVGSSITVDTTGNVKLIENGMNFTAKRGQMIIIGIPPIEYNLSVHLQTFMQTGKILRGTIEGDVTPSVYIPKMIQWYRDGKFPIDKMLTFYPASEFDKAITEMKDGTTIKPVLVW